MSTCQPYLPICIDLWFIHIYPKVWHTYGIWVGACVYFIISANLMLAWYIDWYRTSLTCSGNERRLVCKLNVRFHSCQKSFISFFPCIRLWWQQVAQTICCICVWKTRCIQSQLLDFPLAPFFAIFCRSWLMVCIMGDLLRFCFILARDVWEDDAQLSGELSCFLSFHEPTQSWLCRL